MNAHVVGRLGTVHVNFHTADSSTRHQAVDFYMSIGAEVDSRLCNHLLYSAATKVTRSKQQLCTQCCVD